MKDNVGIVGYWFATNYGGVATYYSLYQTVKRIGFNPILVENPYYYTDHEGVDVFSRNFFKEIGANINEPCDMEHLNELNNIADTFILGSDQVFTTFGMKTFGRLFLMEFAEDSKKKIAVSASLGGDNLESDPKVNEYGRKLMERFSKITIREYAGLDVIKRKLGIKATYLLDPIFQTTPEEYEELGNQSGLKEEEPFVFAYILDPTDDKRRGVQKVAETTGLNLKIGLDGRKYTHDRNFNKMGLPNVTLPELDFKQWLYYYTHASYIVTDSFHGAAMAMILNKPFIIYANYARGYQRFQSLVKVFDIQDRLIEKTSQMDNTLINSVIDFGRINEIIAARKQAAYNDIRDALVTPKDKFPSIELQKNSVATTLPENKCVGCGACVSACPVSAITLDTDMLGYYRSSVDVDLCIDCGKCSKVCPQLHLPSRENLSTPDCYEILANDEDVVWKSSSGGIFTLIANRVLQENGVVVGAAWNDEHVVEHIFIDSASELDKLRKSKYLQSYMGNTDEEVLRYLKQGRKVFFTGTPCQVAGLRSFLGRDYDNLIVMDIFCGTAPSAGFFKRYIKDAFPDGIEAYEFRSKDHGYNCECITITDKDNNRIIKHGPKEDLYQRVFHNHVMCAPHCEHCQFQTVPRYGDITSGDFWGLHHFDPEADLSKGISVVLCNNEKGKKIVEEIPGNLLKVRKKVPLHWVGGNGYAINGSHNYASPKRDRFFYAIQRMRFSDAVNYALKDNQGMYNDLYANTTAPLRLDSNLSFFKFDSNVWEEHIIDGKITLLVKPDQWKPGRYANLPMARLLDPNKEYVLNARFKIKTEFKVLTFHLRDDGTNAIQILGNFVIPEGNNGSQWYEHEIKFKPDMELYDLLMFGASQVSGPGNFLMIDYISIQEA